MSEFYDLPYTGKQIEEKLTRVAGLGNSNGKVPELSYDAEGNINLDAYSDARGHNTRAISEGSHAFGVCTYGEDAIDGIYYSIAGAKAFTLNAQKTVFYIANGAGEGIIASEAVPTRKENDPNYFVINGKDVSIASDTDISTAPYLCFDLYLNTPILLEDFDKLSGASILIKIGQNFDEVGSILGYNNNILTVSPTASNPARLRRWYWRWKTSIDDKGDPVLFNGEPIEPDLGLPIVLIYKFPNCGGDADWGKGAFCANLDTRAVSTGASAFGNETLASGRYSFAAGHTTTANGYSSTAFGKANKALGEYSFVVGNTNEANGASSFAAGTKTIVNGKYSFGAGYNTEINSDYAFGAGYGITVNRNYGAAFGMWNNGDSNNIFEVGVGGNANNRKNALAIQRNGTVTIPGTLEVGTISNSTFGNLVATNLAFNSTLKRNDSYVVDTGVNLASKSLTNTLFNLVSTDNVYGEGDESDPSAVIFTFKIEDTSVVKTLKNNSTAYSRYHYLISKSKKTYSSAKLKLVNDSYYEISWKFNINDLPESEDFVYPCEFATSLGVGLNIDINLISTKDGNIYTYSISPNQLISTSKITAKYHAFAGGFSNAALGHASSALGLGNTVVGGSAFAAGSLNIVEGEAAVAAGKNNKALHAGSSTFGLNLETGVDYQTVLGKYNAIAKDALLVVGNGNNESNPENIFTVNKDGTATVKTGPKKAKDVATKEFVVDSLSSKADVSHSHSEYAASSHLHDDKYAAFSHTHEPINATNNTLGSVKGPEIVYPLIPGTITGETYLINSINNSADRIKLVQGQTYKIKLSNKDGYKLSGTMKLEAYAGVTVGTATYTITIIDNSGSFIADRGGETRSFHFSDTSGVVKAEYSIDIIDTQDTIVDLVNIESDGSMKVNKVSKAILADRAEAAVKATQDADGNAIAETYVKYGIRHKEPIIFNCRDAGDGYSDETVDLTSFMGEHSLDDIKSVSGRICVVNSSEESIGLMHNLVTDPNFGESSPVVSGYKMFHLAGVGSNLDHRNTSTSGLSIISCSLGVNANKTLKSYSPEIAKITGAENLDMKIAKIKIYDLTFHY